MSLELIVFGVKSGFLSHSLFLKDNEETLRYMDRKKMRGIVEGLAAEAVGALGMELVGVDLKASGRGYHIIVYIDKVGGIFLEDCETVSKSLGELLDLSDPIPTGYVLEVSSPGTERPLTKRDDFLRFRGGPVKIRTIDKINGSKNFIGILADVWEDSLLLKGEKEEVEISFQNIFKANLYDKKGGSAK